MARYALVGVGDQVADALTHHGFEHRAYRSLDEFAADAPRLFSHVVISRTAPNGHITVTGAFYAWPNLSVICLDDRPALPWPSDTPAIVLSPGDLLASLTAPMSSVPSDPFAPLDITTPPDSPTFDLPTPTDEWGNDQTNGEPSPLAASADQFTDDQVTPDSTFSSDTDRWLLDPDSSVDDPALDAISPTLTPPAQPTATDTTTFPTTTVLTDPTPAPAAPSLTNGPFVPAATGNKAIIITVVSSKGGVGKTTVSTNLAGAFASMCRKNVLVCDVDLNDPNAGSRFGVTRPTILGLFAVGAPKLTPSNLHEHLAHAKSANVWIANPPYTRAGERLDQVILPRSYMEKIVAPCEELFDVIIFDCPAEYKLPLVRELALPQAQSILLITDTEKAAVTGLAVYQRRMVEELNIPLSRMGVIINMDVEKEGLPRAQIIEALQGCEVLATLTDNRRAALNAATRGTLLINQLTETGESARQAFGAVVARFFPDVDISRIEGVSLIGGTASRRGWKRWLARA